MRLRIVSGSLGGRFLTVRGRDGDFRPTSERVREAVANRLRPRAASSQVGDFCAGSGAFGFEMLSAGAGFVHFVEKDRGRAEVIRGHARQFGVEDRCAVFACDIRSFLAGPGQSYDIVYFDPPYDDAELRALTPALIARLNQGGVLIYERRTSREATGPAAGQTELSTYGDTTLEFFAAPSL